MLPFGASGASAVLDRPSLLVAALGVALLSSVLSYGLELVALRRMPTRVFGVLMSLEPAAAALAGLVVLGQELGPREVVALLLVSTAQRRRHARRSGSAVGRRRPQEQVPAPARGLGSAACLPRRATPPPRRGPARRPPAAGRAAAGRRGPPTRRPPDDRDDERLRAERPPHHDRGV